MGRQAKRSTQVIKFIETFCKVPEGKLVGQPIKLAKFQRRFIEEIYDNPAITRRAYLSIARKNAKSATIACLLLAHLVGPEAVKNSQIVSGARSRDQAALIFNLAQKMIQLDETLTDNIRVIPSRKILVGLPLNVEYVALSAEAKTKHGLSPVLAILDEIGQIIGPQDDFVDAITTAQGAHDRPLLIAISTQAPNDGDLFSVWLDDAKNSGDPRIISHLYAADEKCDLLDEEAWKAANPALGIFRSLDDLKEQAIQASRMPSAENTFRNLCLNQRISQVASFVSRDVWQSCGEALEFDPDLPVYGGLDLSARTDLTALVLIQPQGKHIAVKPFFFVPSGGLVERAKRDRVPYDVWHRQGYLITTPGATVDYGFVADEIGNIVADYDIETIAYDRWRIDILKKEFENIGLNLPLLPFGQGFRDMSPAIDVLESALLNEQVRHGNHPVLTMCAANSVLSRDPAGNRKLDKHKATGRIDGMVALAMAFGALHGSGRVERATVSYLNNYDLMVL
jgi:phage terminase large subunit-like protein